MKMLPVIARNIVNVDAIENWITESFQFPDGLKQWMAGPLRKWIIKSAPAVKADLRTGNLPSWLKDAMDKGDAPEEVVLDQALQTRIQPVVDYMSHLVVSNPATNVMNIGFTVAEARSVEWHKRLAEKSKDPIPPMVEEGTIIEKDYGDGWTWRALFSAAALDREGRVMGHCVGNGSYFEMMAKADTKIYSLRDRNNEPHVTVQVSKAQNFGAPMVRQIQGKQNTAIKSQYLPYVRDFLVDHVFSYINFSGCESIADDVVSTKLTNGVPVFEADGLKLMHSVRSILPHLDVVKDGKVVGAIGLELRVLSKDDLSGCASICRKYFTRANAPLMARVPELLMHDTLWTAKTGWCSAVNDAAQEICKMLGGATGILLDSNHVQAYVSRNKLVVVYGDPKQFLLQCPVPFDAVYALSSPSNTSTLTELPELTKWFKQRSSAAKIVTTSDLQLLNTLLGALNQPDVAAIKATYLKLAHEDEITDGLLKANGFSVGGRVINALAVLLLASLAVKNPQPFRQYVFSKPNMMKCLEEVMIEPDHIKRTLEDLSLAANLVASIIELLRNEFARVLPTEDELDAMSLAPALHSKLSRAVRHAKSHKPNKQRSNAIWQHPKA